MGRSGGKEGFWLVDSRCTEHVLAPLRDAQCFHQVLAALLSLGLMVGGCVVKLPQLLRIYRARSVTGLSELSVFVETLASWLFVSYNVLEHHPLMTWGEVIPLALLNMTITLLFWKFRPTGGEIRRATTGSMTAALATKERTFSPGERKIAASSLAFVAVTVFWLRCFTRRSLRVYQVFSSVLGFSPVPLLLLSRIPQILKNVEQKHTGQLSAGSYVLMVSGNLARLYTTIGNLSDRFILVSCSLALVLNVIPLSQIVWYRQRTRQLLKHSERPTSHSERKVKAT